MTFRPARFVIKMILSTHPGMPEDIYVTEGMFWELWKEICGGKPKIRGFPQIVYRGVPITIWDSELYGMPTMLPLAIWPEDDGAYKPR